jgi:hypothetical protein
LKVKLPKNAMKGSRKFVPRSRNNKKQEPNNEIIL